MLDCGVEHLRQSHIDGVDRTPGDFIKHVEDDFAVCREVSSRRDFFQCDIFGRLDLRSITCDVAEAQSADPAPQARDLAVLRAALRCRYAPNARPQQR